MSSFQGIWVPVVTPFQDSAIDFSGLRRLVGHLLDKHVAGIMVCTTTGEAASLSRQEQLAVLDAVSVGAGAPRGDGPGGQQPD
ncbi:4-hydroxy-tetrahydrodipicolinate synthase [Pseudomonas fluorescens]|nr:4-hydroxy-tetrahydrodipicolinate synthase [Pseudomonas fluorescens]